MQTSLWAMYWLNYLDRNAIALAKCKSVRVWHFLISVSTIEDDLGLSDVQYQTCVSILFVGYVITGIPSNMLITRVKVPTFLVAVMMTWAVISIATGLTKNYMGLLLTRYVFLLLKATWLNRA